MRNRLLLFYLLNAICYLLLFFQLFHLQVIQGKRNLSLSEGNRIKIEKIKAPRGIIYDREGKPLVYNVPKDTSEVKSADTSEVEGVELSRDYLYGPVLAHLLGYVDVDFIGQSGLEKEYEEVLAGEDGGELIEVDTKGKKTRLIGKQEPVPGENLHLTIDLSLQKKAYQALGNKKGAVIVSQPQTGEILALVSKPSFDPNVFSLREFSKDTTEVSADSTLEVERVLDDPNQPLFNRAIHGVYPPGSIFKIVTAVAGLETGMINANTLILDTGEIRIGKYRYGNWYFDRFGKTEGFLDVVKAIKRSNDIFFYRVGERVGARELVNWAKIFGLAEKVGFLPDPENERWFLGNTYHLSIGQGKIGVTPLQVNMMTNVIANGGYLCPPKFLTKSSLRTNLSEECQEVGLKKETIELIKKGMREACSEGGTSLRFLEFDFPVACKTGTAEFGPSTSSGQARTHAWFTVFVLAGEASAKSDAEPISITVLVEAGGEGSQVAAPIAKEVLGEWLEKK